MINSPAVFVLYDDECPFCRNYMRLSQLRSIANVELIDARLDSPLKKEAMEKGYDLDQGIVVKIDDQYLHGAEAMAALAAISSQNLTFNRLMLKLFNSPFRKIIYTLCRFGRWSVLKLQGKKMINEMNN